MKSFVYAAVAASILAAPLAAFAQSDAQQPATRAQVRADLIQLEQNGYRPEASDAQYPDNIQAAERRAQASPQTQTLTHADTSGYGVQPVNETQSGRRVVVAPSSPNSVYFGH
jgi:Ni/Co efflux regulator RcnB